MNSHFSDYRVKNLLDADQAHTVLAYARSVQPQMLRGRDVLAVLQRAHSAWLHDEQWRRLAINCVQEFGAQTHAASADVSQLEAISSMLDPAVWQIKLGVELSLPRALDEVHESARSEAVLAYRALGVLLHICPGNSFLGGLDSVLHGVLTGNCNLAKLSRNAPAVIAVMRDLLESCGLPRGQILPVLWQGGASEIETTLATAVDGVVVWGGNATIMHYKHMLPVGVRLLEYGPKLSLSVLTSKARSNPSLLAGLVADVCLYEQASCSSSQILLVEMQHPIGSAGYQAERSAIMQEIGAQFAAYTEHSPPLNKTRHEQIEILKTLERAKLAKSRGQGDYLAAYPDWLLVWMEDGKPIQPSPLFRTWMIYPWHAAQDISQHLAAIRHYLQTVSVACQPAQLSSLTERLWQAGVNRVVAAGRSCVASNGAPHDGGSILAGMCRITSLESSQRAVSLWQSGDEDYVLEHLRRLLSHASAAPFYQRRWQAAELDCKNMSWQEFQRLPWLCKTDFHQFGPPFCNDLLTVPFETVNDGYVFTTGGSTGEPKYAVYSRSEFDEASDIFCQSLQAIGITKQDRVANLFSAGGLWSAFIAVNNALEKLGCLNLTAGGSMEPLDLLRLLHKMGATAVYGLPSTMLRLAHAAQEHPELKVHLRVIVYGGEHMSAAMRDYLHQTFSCELIKSALYAAVDAGCVGYQCAHAHGGVHHALESYAYVEICDEFTGQPVPKGEVGEIVITNLSRRVMPVVRMRTGDLGRELSQACACGGSGMLFELLGRNDDMIRISGANVHVSDVDRLCQRFPDILSPVYQLRIDRLGVDERYELCIETKISHNQQQLATLSEQVRSVYLEIAEEVRDYLADGFLRHFSLSLLEPGALEGNLKTGKIRRVVDSR